LPSARFDIQVTYSSWIPQGFEEREIGQGDWQLRQNNPLNINDIKITQLCMAMQKIGVSLHA
tara:strand:- start:3063 stop:3248 length:186 start_codon:yes stop_codon:yes gene_type:complete